jgi:hypothetical protein
VQSTTNPLQIPQRDRLGSAALKEMVDYWENMFAMTPKIPTKGMGAAVSKDLARDDVLQRIKAPTLVMTADRSNMQINRDGAAESDADSQFAARRSAERCLPHRRRECRCVRHQCPHLHQGGDT